MYSVMISRPFVLKKRAKGGALRLCQWQKFLVWKLGAGNQAHVMMPRENCLSWPLTTPGIGSQHEKRLYRVLSLTQNYVKLYPKSSSSRVCFSSIIDNIGVSPVSLSYPKPSIGKFFHYTMRKLTVVNSRVV